jgi:hypothetical protein
VVAAESVAEFLRQRDGRVRLTGPRPPPAPCVRVVLTVLRFWVHEGAVWLPCNDWVFMQEASLLHWQATLGFPAF